MDVTTDYAGMKARIIDMFLRTFTQSEGEDAGVEIRDLVAEMLASLEGDDLRVFSAVAGEEILASIFFTPVTFPEDPRSVYILSPVAVAPEHQGKGLGQRLIRHALGALRDVGVDIALTYGDINFYSKVGFSQISEAQARAPQPLSYPEGWLGQSLTAQPFTPLAGLSRCVGPLDNPAHW
ncbi:MAG: N-acetyltransferase [Pseudomonadota bacterium]